MILEFSGQIFEKYSKYQISLKSVQWESSYSMWTDGRTDRRDEADCFFSQFLLTRLQTTAAKVLKKFLDFMEPEGSLPCSQKPVIMSLSERED
jgi:hypothetical protein